MASAVVATQSARSPIESVSKNLEWLHLVETIQLWSAATVGRGGNSDLLPPFLANPSVYMCWCVLRMCGACGIYVMFGNSCHVFCDVLEMRKKCLLITRYLTPSSLVI